MKSDLTARALIRNAALRLFAERGPDAVSVRQIAEQAEVSPGLVLHHYGSKAGLREAVDAHAAAALDDLLDLEDERGVARELASYGESWSFAEMFARVFPPDSPLPAYLRRLLLTGDPAGERLFRSWYEVTAAFLRTMVDEGAVRPSDDPEIQAAFLLANDLAVILLRPQIASVVGVDPLTSDGLDRWAKEVLGVYREGLVGPTQDTSSARSAEDENAEAAHTGDEDAKEHSHGREG